MILLGNIHLWAAHSNCGLVRILDECRQKLIQTKAILQQLEESKSDVCESLKLEVFES